MLKRILYELRHHAPFTLSGTVLGVAILFLMAHGRVSRELSEGLFWICHPAHVFLSAVVTAGLYRVHGRRGWWATLLVGYVGSVGVSTISDSLIPYVGEAILRMEHAHVHAGFLEQWYVVNPVALLGIALGYFWKKTTFPHAGHVLLSTWASLFHMTMAAGDTFNVWMLLVLPVFLFLAVWLPCCTSDIVFPLLFVPSNQRPGCSCGHEH